MVDVLSKEKQMTTLEGLNSVAQLYVTPQFPNGTRGSSKDSFIGYVASKDYIVKRVKELAPELVPVMLSFEDHIWKSTGMGLEITKPTEKVFDTTGSTAIRILEWSGNGPVTGELAFPSDPDVKGCNFTEDYTEDNMKGKIAFIRDGMGCWPPCMKVRSAMDNGATGVIFVSDEGEDPFFPWWLLSYRETWWTKWCGEDYPLPIVPVFSVNHEVGQELNKSKEIKMTSQTETDFTTGSLNTCVDLPGGDPNKVVIIGAHLDTSEAGPGINDNGSGSALVLDLVRAFVERYGSKGDSALQKNSFRACWWGSGMRGHRGSRGYVKSLSQAEREKILAYINFDMVGSPNGANGVHPGSADEWNPTASGYIEEQFRAAFTAQGEKTKKKVYAGDAKSFKENSIPYGGLHAGGRDTFDSQEEAADFGSTNSSAMDVCYNKACDTLDHIDMDRMFLGSKVAATVVQNFLEDAQLSDKLKRQNLKDPLNPPVNEDKLDKVFLATISDSPSDNTAKAEA